MKLNKIFALGLAALTLTACSDDDDKVAWNSAEGVSVELGQTQVSVKEDRGLFFIPINLVGEANGCVKVTLGIEEVSHFGEESRPAIEEADFWLTTKTIVMSPDDTTDNIEISVKDNPEPGKEVGGSDSDRAFRIVITNVEYASIGTNSFVDVNILDKGAAPQLDGLPEKWMLYGRIGDAESGTMTSAKSNMTKGETTEENGVQSTPVTMSNFTNSALGVALQLPVEYQYNPRYFSGVFFLPYGGLLSDSPINFGDAGILYPCVASETGAVPSSGGVTGLWNDDYTGFSFSEELMMGLLNSTTMAPSGYIWQAMGQISAEFYVED